MLASRAIPGQVVSPAMGKSYTITLDEFDLGQVLDGLEVRAKAWEETAQFLRTGEMARECFVAEECSDADEAERLADHYRAIIENIRKQREEQE